MDAGREGAGIRPRVTDMVLGLHIQLPLYCPIAEPIHTMQREHEEEKGAIEQRAQSYALCYVIKLPKQISTDQSCYQFNIMAEVL